MNFHEFYTMGGYAPYVWPSFGLAALTFISQWLLTVHKKRRTLERLKTFWDRHES